MGSILGHVCVVRGVDDPMVALLAGVSTDRLASVSRLFVSPVARPGTRAWPVLARGSVVVDVGA